jgi:hypothetical protein
MLDSTGHVVAAQVASAASIVEISLEVFAPLAIVLDFE